MSDDIDILQRLTALEKGFEGHSETVKQNHSNLMLTLTELKQGIGVRVEQAGKDIAVLQESNKGMNYRIKDLESSKKWVVTSIIGAYLAHLAKMVFKG